MEFGRVDDLSGIDFRLPEDPEMTISTLKAAKGGGNLEVYVGCTKWAHKPWVGTLYPKGTDAKQFLKQYALNFNTIEFSSTFYTIPSPERIAQWAAETKFRSDFKFCPKLPQNITHIRRLRNAEAATNQFYDSIRAFGNQLGPVMVQMGESFTPKNHPELRAYLAYLPKEVPVFIELRHKDWFAQQDNRTKLFDTLKELNIGTVISDTAGRRDCVHMELTTPHTMIRFVGNNLDKTDYTRIDEWVARLKDWKEKGLQSVWFFMHQNDENFSPEACAYLIGKLNEQLSLNVSGPVLSH